MANSNYEYNPFSLVITGAAAWAVPGGGYLLLGETKRALLVCVTIALTFALGLYIGSLGVIDSIHAKPWYMAQLMNSPAVMLIAKHVIQTNAYPVFGKPQEIGQIYTSIAGLLNLLCIVNSVYRAHYKQLPHEVTVQ